MTELRLGLNSIIAIVFVIVAMISGPSAADEATDCAKSTGDDAIAACTRRIESADLKAQDLVIALDHRGLALLRKGDIDHASADFNEAIRLDPNYPDAFFHRGLTSANNNRHDPDRAIADYSEALRIDPTLVAALYNRGIEYRRGGDADHAIADFSEVIRLDPTNADAFFARGHTWADNKGDHDHAIADYSEAIRRNPKFVTAINNRGIEYRLKGDLDHALVDHNEAVRLDPHYAYAYYYRAYVWRSKGDADRAIADFTETIRLDPSDADAFFQRGVTWANNKRNHDHAIADYGEALRLNPNFLTALYNRGIEYRRKGDADRAIADLTEAIRLDPNYADAFFQRGVTWANSKRDYDHAIKDYSEAFRLNPKMVAAINNRGIEYRLKGDLDRALTDHNEAIRIDANYAYGYYYRAFVLRSKGDADRAIADFTETIRLDPNDADAFFERGQTWANNKRNPDHAIADYGEAIRLNPNFAVAINNRGLLYERIGSFDRALADFRAVLANDPSAATAAERIRRIEHKLAALLEPTPALSSPASPAAREVRVALVIGNSSYVNGGRLPNPKSDAEKLAATLKRLGFSTVTLKLDLPRDQLNEALKAFAAQADRADWAVVYYAGHGIEIGGINYLVPIDVKLASDRDISYEAVGLDQVLLAVEGAQKLRLVILDACRDNPFAKTMVRTNSTRSMGRGLVRVEPEGATLVAYAAKEGHIASDGEGGNSPFVTALVKNLETPGLEINFLFRKVRDDVLKVTGNRQEPYVYGSLPAEAFYFRR
jgi:tetratricopeptide (TPR) repeat protein